MAVREESQPAENFPMNDSKKPTLKMWVAAAFLLVSLPFRKVWAEKWRRR